VRQHQNNLKAKRVSLSHYLMSMYDVIIIGSGPAGLTAGIYCQRLGLTPVIIAGRKWGGQLQLTTDVENFPGFGPILGPELMQKMRDHVTSLNVPIMDVWATNLDEAKQPFTLTLEEGKTIQGKAVIIATGADTKWLGVPGEGNLRGRGVSSCAPCDAFFFRGKSVAVVGGGDSAMEEAQVLAKVASDVIVIHRRDEFRAQKASFDKLRQHSNVRFIYNTRVLDVLGEKNLTGLQLTTDSISPKQGVKTFDALVKKFGGENTDGKNTWVLPRAGVFVAIGLVPNTQFLKGFECTPNGYLKRMEEQDEHGNVVYYTKTKIPGIFTAGDVHDARYKQAVTAAGFGAMAALDVDKWLSEQE
jgi:thioredoxin reductase (NADPH)